MNNINISSQIISLRELMEIKDLSIPNEMADDYKPYCCFPYLWDTKIDSFLEKIFKKYTENNTLYEGEIKVSGSNQIVDGQTNISHLLVLLKIISLKYLNAKYEPPKFFTSFVDDGKEDEYLRTFLTLKSYEVFVQETKKEENSIRRFQIISYGAEEASINGYVCNGRLIDEFLEKYFSSLKEEKTFDFNGLLHFILEEIKFTLIKADCPTKIAYSLFDIDGDCFDEDDF